MCNVSDVPYAHVRDPERDRGRRRLAVRQVRAALGCHATGGDRDVCRVGRRFRSRTQGGPEGSQGAALYRDSPTERLGGTP